MIIEKWEEVYYKIMLALFINKMQILLKILNSI
jgi:hypothetical protein